MDRRDFFKRSAASRQKRSIRRAVSGTTPYSGQWTINEVSHLLSRTMFGAKKADVDHFLQLSPTDAVDELLNTTFTPLPPVRDYDLLEDDGVMYDDVGVAIGQTWVNDANVLSAPVIRGQINARRTESLRKWWAGLIINQERSIQEKMVLFWHHHFSVQESEIGNAQFLFRHHHLLRTNALGNFKTLVREVTIDPAMLLHLNGYLNTRQAPDENYARELQELFTIGKGNDSAYSENDVIAAARVLTGWRITENPLSSYLDVNAHDTGNKTFSAFYNNTTINGSSDPDVELDALMDLLFSTTESARFICRKLYKWFVYYEIDEATERDLITPMAEELMNNNFEVKPALSLLFKSEHFFDPINQACYIKSPFDFIAGTLREFSVSFPSYSDYTNGYPLFMSIYRTAADMQQNLFQPPDVSGWPSYYQEPMHYELWVNSNSLPKRADFTDQLVSESVIDIRAFASITSNASDPNQLILDTTSLLLRYPLSHDSRNYIKNRFLLNNSTDDSIWTNAWNSNNTTIITPALQGMFSFIMNLPEFHLC
jgi:uncharacterized protein (DUF1800 family)